MDLNNYGILFDYARQSRIGLPEAVFCEGKPQERLLALLEEFSSGSPPILFTRLKADRAALLPTRLMSCYDYDPISGTAFAAKMPARTKGKVAVISAGAADGPVAKEAARTLEYLGIQHILFEDCGISALWRLTERLRQLQDQSALIVVAGMEGALASVVAGLCSAPIFAVPTSIGYGAGAGGFAALAGMLSSCAPGIGVMNIDNGYGAACAAARVINSL